MAETHAIERRGMAVLRDWLEAHGRTYEPSDRREFDLKVDGQYAELKATSQTFFGLTDNQFRALKDGTLAIVFVVNGSEVTEFSRNELIAHDPKTECTHYWYRTWFDKEPST